MNYGSMGGLLSTPSGSYEFHYSKEIFSAFCLSHKSKLYGLYYPCPSAIENADYKHETLKHDFLITPIPHDLWKASARIHVYFKNASGTLNKICKYLEERQVSIVHSESSRSSHRYSTWSLHIVFNKLLQDDNFHYNPDESCYDETKAALKRFIDDFTEDEEIKDNLYTPESKESITGHVNFALAFFNEYRKKNPGHSFTLTVYDPDKSHRKRTLQTDEAFIKLMANINPLPVPATTFSEIDAYELNLRTVLIPERAAKRFFKVKLIYNCEKNQDTRKLTYVGIIHAITRRLPLKYNIWHSYDRTIHNDPEQGEIVFLIENTSAFLSQEGLQSNRKGLDAEKDWELEDDKFTADAYQNEAIAQFESIVKHYHDAEFKFEPPEISKLPAAGAMKELFIEQNRQSGQFEFDVFISYSHKDTEFVEKNIEPLFNDKEKAVYYYLDSRQMQSGVRLDEELLKNIEKSREMCVITSGKSSSSTWMAIERGASWILRKRITCIRINEKVHIPEILKMTLYVDGFKQKELEKYRDEVINRRDKYLGKKFGSSFNK